MLYGLAAMLLVSLSEPLLTPVFNGIGLRAVGEFLYQSGGLTVAGAIVIFLVSAGLIYSRERFRKPPSPAEEQAPTPITDRPIITRNRIVLAIVGVVLVVLPWVVGDRIADILGTVGLYVLLGLGLNIVVGYAGLLDLGYVAFFAVGAYSIAIFTSPQSFLVRPEGGGVAEAGLTNFWVALIPTVIIAVLIGVLIGAPVLRLRGDYLAIVTLGFGEIIRTLVLSDWLAPYLGGAQGITQVPAPPPEGLDLRDPADDLLPDPGIRHRRRLHRLAAGRMPGWAAPGRPCARTSRSPRPWGCRSSDTSCSLLPSVPGSAVSAVPSSPPRSARSSPTPSGCWSRSTCSP